jgi:hypothetical protein
MKLVPKERQKHLGPGDGLGRVEAIFEDEETREQYLLRLQPEIIPAPNEGMKPTSSSTNPGSRGGFQAGKKFKPS